MRAKARPEMRADRVAEPPRAPACGHHAAAEPHAASHAIAIALPAGALNRLLRHPAIRALGPSRAAWQVTEAGRSRCLSRADAPLQLVLHVGEQGLRLCPEGRAGAAVLSGGVSALGAVLGGRLPAWPVLREGRRVGLEDQADTAAALAEALRDGLTQLRLHAPACLAEAPAVGVHQSRVALRRMRSMLKLFRPALQLDGLVDFDARLRVLATALGPARDLDVFRTGVGAALAEALPDEPRLATLHRRAAAARLAAYAALPPLLHGPGFRAVLWQGAALIERLEALPAKGDLRDFAAGVLARRHRRLKRAGDDIENLPPAALHALRLDGKRLRYAAELLLPLWDGRAGRRYLRRLARLQEALGLANDAEVARGLVRGLGVRGWALGAAEGLALGHAAGSRDQALAAWSKWRRGRRFWAH